MVTPIPLTLKIHLLDSGAQIAKKIAYTLSANMYKAMKKVAPKILSQTKALLKSAIESSATYQSLLSGQLQAEFGIPDPELKLPNLIQYWIRSVKVIVNAPVISGTKAKCVMTLNAVPSQWGEVISLPEATVLTSKGEVLPWLDWLLNYGVRIIITEYDVEFNPKIRSFSRTGQAIMTHGSYKTWHVPNDFAGTKDDNWITRILDNISDDVQQIIIQNVQGMII